MRSIETLTFQGKFELVSKFSKSSTMLKSFCWFLIFFFFFGIDIPLLWNILGWYRPFILYKRVLIFPLMWVHELAVYGFVFRQLLCRLSLVLHNFELPQNKRKTSFFLFFKGKSFAIVSGKSYSVDISLFTCNHVKSVAFNRTSMDLFFSGSVACNDENSVLTLYEWRDL